jgi:23S rRNA pseudouridine2605 synthase
MRINRYIALAAGMSRRAADAAVAAGRAMVDNATAKPGTDVIEGKSLVMLDGKVLVKVRTTQTIILNKPIGYVVSRAGQGAKTIYHLLPPDLHHLKPVGRLDKDSSGLLLLTNDGVLANDLTHPSRQKIKIYEVSLDKPLQPLHRQMIAEMGVQLEDGSSLLGLERAKEGNDRDWIVTMHEGRNRQIRRTFAALGYSVTRLHRVRLGKYHLANLEFGEYQQSL